MEVGSVIVTGAVVAALIEILKYVCRKRGAQWVDAPVGGYVFAAVAGLLAVGAALVPGWLPGVTFEARFGLGLAAAAPYGGWSAARNLAPRLAPALLAVTLCWPLLGASCPGPDEGVVDDWSASITTTGDPDLEAVRLEGAIVAGAFKGTVWAVYEVQLDGGRVCIDGVWGASRVTACYVCEANGPCELDPAPATPP